MGMESGRCRRSSILGSDPVIARRYHCSIRSFTIRDAVVVSIPRASGGAAANGSFRPLLIPISLFSKLAVDGKYLDGDRRVGHTSHRERAGGGIREEFPKNTMTDTCNGKYFWPQPRAAGNGIGTPIIRVSC